MAGGRRGGVTVFTVSHLIAGPPTRVLEDKDRNV